MLERIASALEAIRDELRAWRPPELTGCPHPTELRQDLSSMGEKWVRCKGCGADLIRTGSMG